VLAHGGKVYDVPLEHTDVRIRIDGHVADTTVVQRYKNPQDTKIETVYLFPLPTGAAVTDMSIVTGAQKIRGAIDERAKAQQTYAAAKSRGHVAALLTQERANLFTQSVANIEPNATIEITLRYVQRLDYEDGGYSLVFPMVAGPRYMPPRSGTKADAAVVQVATVPAGMRSSHEIGLHVELDAGVAIEELVSPSHQITIERPAPSKARVALQSSDNIANRDFILTYHVAGTAPKLALLTDRAGDGGSFMLIAQPPAAPAAETITPREIIFVLDTSSSMRGAPLGKAKELIRRVLWTLRSDDTFQIVRFADKASSLGTAPIANKPKNISLTLDWLAALEAGGGTEVTDGVAAALAVPHDPLRLRLVVFLSDGYVGNEDEILAQVGRHIGTARLFSFGIGSAVNRYLLEEMAAIGRGAVQVVRPDEDTAKAVSAFERRIDSPVLTDVRIDWGTLPIADVTPAAIPDLFTGQPLVVTGHYKGTASGTAKVHAKQAGRDVVFEIPVALSERDASRPAIGSLWARHRIGELSRGILRKRDTAVEREIVRLSIEHRVLSQLTAFVAVDDSRVSKGGPAKRVPVAVEIPESVRGIQVGGGFGGGMTGIVGGYGTYGTSFGAIGYGYSSAGSGFGTGHVVSSKTVTVPTVTIGHPIARGELDKAIIRRYVKRHLQKITYCYEKQLLINPTLAGSVKSEFIIDGDTGRVIGVATTGLGDKEVEACIAQVIKAIEFPKAEGSGQIKVNYPFIVRPAGN
jgi:Ca-activated chloride channel family protein